MHICAYVLNLVKHVFGLSAMRSSNLVGVQSRILRVCAASRFIANFRAHYMDAFWSLNAKNDAVCFYCEDFDNDFLTNDDTLIFRPTEDQHAM